MAVIEIKANKNERPLAYQHQLTRTLEDLLDHDLAQYIPGRDALVQFLQSQKQDPSPYQAIDAPRTAANFGLDALSGMLTYTPKDLLLDLMTSGGASAVGMLATPRALEAVKGTKITTKSGRPQLLYHVTKPGRWLEDFVTPHRVQATDYLNNQGLFFYPRADGSIQNYGRGRGSKAEYHGATFPAFINSQNPLHAERLDPEQWKQLLATFMDNPSRQVSATMLPEPRQFTGYGTSRAKTELFGDDNDFYGILPLMRDAIRQPDTYKLQKVLEFNPALARDAGFDSIIGRDTVGYLSSKAPSNPEAFREIIAIRGDTVIDPISGRGLPEIQNPYGTFGFSPKDEHIMDNLIREYLRGDAASRFHMEREIKHLIDTRAEGLR